MTAVAPAGRTGDVLAATGDARGLLTRTEPDRAGALRSAADRGDFVARTRQAPRRPPVRRPARSLTLVQSRGRPQGGPRLTRAPGVGVSLAHTRGRAAAAASHGPVPDERSR
ncbi:hypothetical protein HW130_21515 [Streptomyces sp. PKU-EA00015]|uniref:hypothetical protein n=1 Tax=Streptomyces sp. PKU-EA00015 TaxID=2748326 RepID=UPI0015A2D757|nr:hypothetical protein [Streptomyces sp. PKU-EA00015]NWF28806.1 hypothetical protein [Streptomyces sp. PKU-EA00015]